MDLLAVSRIAITPAVFDANRRGGNRRAIRLKKAQMELVNAVIFDYAGTVVDYGSLAPMGAFVETFAEFGVTISIDEARGSMGMASVRASPPSWQCRE
jgi:hypothetical protein